MNTFNLITYLLKAYPSRSILMIICMICSGFAEGLSLVSLMPLLQLFMDGKSASDSAAFIMMQQFLAMFSLEPTVAVLLVVIVLGIVMKAIFLFVANVLTEYAVAHVTSDLRHNLIDALMSANWNFFVRQQVGFFSNAITSETERVATAYQHVALLIATIVQVCAYIVTAMVISWEISLLAVIIGLAMLILLRGIVNMSRNAGETQTIMMKSLNARLADAVCGIKPIKAMGLENRFKPLLHKDIDSINMAQKKKAIASSAMHSIQEPVLVIIIALGLYIAISFWDQPFSSLLVMAFLFYRLAGRIFNAQICYQTIITQESALWSLDKHISKAKSAAEHTKFGTKPLLNHGIYFENVTFGYNDHIVLNDTSFVIRKGKITAIYGPSGVGKTTIADLIVGLQLPLKGIIKLDETPLTDINIRDWRSKIGYVPQEIFLFHDTIKKNITLGDSSILPEDINLALEMAGASEFVASMPLGLETVIGERGSMLSGGQRQRISIARALARKPILLVLDEVTTALDPKTEWAICNTLENLDGKITILSISHQEAMLKIADVVYQIENHGITQKSIDYELQDVIN